MRINTTVTMDDSVLSQARQSAAAEGTSLSAWIERVMRAELMRLSADVAAEWERTLGDSLARADVDLEQQHAVNEAINTSGQAW